jgi:hypothetical protein
MNRANAQANWGAPMSPLRPVLALLSLLTSRENIPAKIKAFRPFVEERLDTQYQIVIQIDNPNQIGARSS